MAQPIPKKSLGQHWLTDQSTLQNIVAEAEIGPTDTVLEIGPGLGSLTAELVQVAGQVVAVEVDEQLARQLPSHLPATNLRVIQTDILQLDLTVLPPDYKVVANIPYYLTSNLIRILSESANPPQLAVLLVQKEVAQRLAAEPGALSILGVIAQFYWQVSLGELVPAQLFTPPPKVDSQVVILRHRAEPLFLDVSPKAFFRLVKAGFAQRRKTLLNALSSGLQLTKDQVKTICTAAGIQPSQRAQTLSLEEWHQLYEALNVGQ